MRSYQSVLILKPDFDETQVGESLEKITSLIKSHGGECLKVDKWGKKRLAYKVKKNRFGYYLNIYHTCENEKVSSLEAKYKLYDAIIKFMVLRLDDKELERAMGNGEAEETEGNGVKAEAESKKEDAGKQDEKESVKEASASDEKKEGDE
ncbi:MAG: 30S ribosomal protein S6 [Nitrospinae bacterium]|nr:30S ribosomal protein S6 [Nitrospinota bacterium]